MTDLSNAIDDSSRTAPPNAEHLLQRLELAVNGSGLGVWEFEIATGRVTWDRQMRTIYGVDATYEITRDKWYAFVHPDDRETGVTRFERAMQGEVIERFESRIVRHDGSIRYLEGTGRMQTDASGKPLLLVGLSRDITDQKNADLHQCVVAQAMTMIAQRRPLPEVLESIVSHFEKTRTAIYCSIMLLDSTGRTFLFGAGPKLQSFYDECISGVTIGPEVGSCGAAVTLGQRVIVGNIQTDPMWEKFRRVALKYDFASSWSEPIKLGDRILGTFAIYHRQPQTPTTAEIKMIEACAKLAAVAIHHRQTEDELDLQRSKLLTSIKMAALGEMSTGIAHEINNPLTLIVGKAWQLRKQIETETFDRTVAREELGKIVDVANRIAKVIKGLQAFSRNAEQDAFERVLLFQIVEDVLELSKERFFNFGITLRVQIENKHLAVAARPAQLSQVLLNLLNNAFDAVSSLEEKWIELRVVEEQGRAVVSVTDSGKGLTPAVADKIMLPFFTTKEVGKGTGLGLSISKGLIEGHRGRLYYDPASPKTRFVFELPLARL